MCASATTWGAVNVAVANLGSTVSLGSTVNMAFPSGRVVKVALAQTMPGMSTLLQGVAFTATDCAGKAACPVTVTIDPNNAAGDTIRTNNTFTIGQCVVK